MRARRFVRTAWSILLLTVVPAPPIVFADEPPFSEPERQALLDNLESATNDMYEAALETVREWRFEPARKDGRPVATIALAPVSFRIWEKKTTPTPRP